MNTSLYEQFLAVGSVKSLLTGKEIKESISLELKERMVSKRVSDSYKDE